MQSSYCCPLLFLTVETTFESLTGSNDTQLHPQSASIFYASEETMKNMLTESIEDAHYGVTSSNAQAKAIVAVAGLVAIGAVFAWRSPAGKKLRAKIANAIAPAESV
jgi:branched-subunit amino acid ABC-type transport system permease component